jgi:ABC-2 type transport system permease protein
VIDDILTVIWKEWKELAKQGSPRTRGTGLMIFFIIIYGVVNPWVLGDRYLTGISPFMGLGSILLVVTVSATVDSFAGERERHTLETLLSTRLSDDAILFGKLLASSAYACVAMLASLLLGLITVNLTRIEHGKFLLFSPRQAVTLLTSLGLATVLASVAAVLVSLHAATVRQASQILAFGSVIIVMTAILGFQSLPEPWQRPIMQMFRPESLLQSEILIGLFVAVLDGALVFVACLRFRRAQLILD